MKKPNFSNLAEFSDYKECGYNSAEEMRDYLELKWYCQPYEDEYEYDRSIDLI